MRAWMQRRQGYNPRMPQSATCIRPGACKKRSDEVLWSLADVSDRASTTCFARRPRPRLPPAHEPPDGRSLYRIHPARSKPARCASPISSPRPERPEGVDGTPRREVRTVAELIPNRAPPKQEGPALLPRARPRPSGSGSQASQREGPGGAGGRQRPNGAGATHRASARSSDGPQGVILYLIRRMARGAGGRLECRDRVAAAQGGAPPVDAPPAGWAPKSHVVPPSPFIPPPERVHGAPPGKEIATARTCPKRR